MLGLLVLGQVEAGMGCSTYQVHTARRQDFNEGWIWIRNADLSAEIEGRRKIVRIKTPHGRKPVYCEAVWADDWYLAECRIPPAADCRIFISNWYRYRLEIDLGQPVDIDISFPKRRIKLVLWQFFACFQHPQIVVVLATSLGMIAVGLGIIGIGLAIIGVQHWTPFEGLGIVSIIAGAATVLLGTAPLFRR